MELPTTSLPLVFWLFLTMLPQWVLVFQKKKIETPPRIHQRSYFENSWILQRFKRILLSPSNAKLTNPSFFYLLSLSVLTLFDPALLLRNFVLQLSVTDLHSPPCPPLSPPPSQIGAKCHISTQTPPWPHNVPCQGCHIADPDNIYFPLTASQNADDWQTEWKGLGVSTEVERKIFLSLKFKWSIIIEC